MTSAKRFLLLHGLGGSGPEHWQSWLAGRLRERGLEVCYPFLPEPDRPRLDDWLAVVEREVTEETTVLCHSLGCLLWLHHAARGPAAQAERALLVAPVQPDEDQPESPGFRPAPLSHVGAAAAARETLLLCSTDDPWGPPEAARRIATGIGAPVEWLERAGHVNAAAGYGPWPWVEEWALVEPA